MTTINEVSQDTIKLEAYLEEKKPGDVLYFSEVENETGVKMTATGKGYLRTAIKRAGHLYIPVRGVGVELVSEKTATTVISHRVIRIDNSVKKAEKTTKKVADKFYEKLNNEQKNHVNFIGSVFAAIRAYSVNAKKILANRPPVQNLEGRVLDVGK